LNSLISIEEDIVRLHHPCSSPKPYANRSPSTISITAFALIVGVHQAGGFERTSAREP
jgi:hypothetical protein